MKNGLGYPKLHIAIVGRLHMYLHTYVHRFLLFIQITIWDIRKQDTINVLSGHTEAVKCITFNKNTHNVSIPVLASVGEYSLKVWDPRPSSPGQPLVSLSLHQPGKEIEAVAISPDGSLIATGARDGNIILMTLFVPTILPRTDSEIKRELHKKTFRSSFHLARQESFSKLGKAEPEITDLALDQMMAEPKLPQNIQLKRIHSRLKRRTRTAEKDLELDQEPTAATTEKEKVNLRISRKNRVKVKSVDLPDMIMYLAMKATAYKPEVFSDSDSGDDQERDKLQQRQKTNKPQGRVAAALKTFQSQPNKKGASKEDSHPLIKSDNESASNYRVNNLDSSVSSSMSALSPSASSPHPFSDTDSTGTTENSDALKTSTPSLGAYHAAGKENRPQNNVLFEESVTYQNDTSHSTEDKADDEDDGIPYSMI